MPGKGEGGAGTRGEFLGCEALWYHTPTSKLGLRQPAALCRHTAVPEAVPLVPGVFECIFMVFIIFTLFCG